MAAGKPFAATRQRHVGGKIGGPFYGRGERIRTSGLLVPNQALYQAEPRPEQP